jgi:hypothetical protein
MKDEIFLLRNAAFSSHRRLGGIFRRSNRISQEETERTESYQLADHLGFLQKGTKIDFERPLRSSLSSLSSVQNSGFKKRFIPIAAGCYTLHEGRKIREGGIGGGNLLRALCDLGVKALGFGITSAVILSASSVASGKIRCRFGCDSAAPSDA